MEQFEIPFIFALTAQNSFFNEERAENFELNKALFE